MKKLVLVVMMAVATAAWSADPKAPAKPADAKAADPKAAPAGGAKLDGAKLYVERTCVACHGKDAKTPILPEYPKLAGQGAVYAERQMKDIKSGARSNGNTAAMKGVMHLVTDEEMKAIAEYVSGLK
jgi:cytochrome c